MSVNFWFCQLPEDKVISLFNLLVSLVVDSHVFTPFPSMTSLILICRVKKEIDRVSVMNLMRVHHEKRGGRVT